MHGRSLNHRSATRLSLICGARSWLPLMLGGGTYYVDACPHMSFFLAGGAPCMPRLWSPAHSTGMLVLKRLTVWRQTVLK